MRLSLPIGSRLMHAWGTSYRVASDAAIGDVRFQTIPAISEVAASDPILPLVRRLASPGATGAILIYVRLDSGFAVAGNDPSDAYASLLASLEMSLGSLVDLRDPRTADLIYEMQNAIDNIRADLAQVSDPSMHRKRANG